METSDEALAQAAADGDGDAFATLVERHYDRIFRLAFRLTGVRDAAEDLTQDLCAALPAKIAGFGGQAQFTTWLYRVVVNAAHDRRRRLATQVRIATGWGEVELARRAEADEAAQALGWLTQAMASLPVELRDTLALTLEDDMTHAQAAGVLGVKEGTISWRMSEIRRRLREKKELET